MCSRMGINAVSGSTLHLPSIKTRQALDLGPVHMGKNH